MVRTLVFLLLCLVTLGAMVTPGFAPLGLLMLVFLIGLPIWWAGFAVTTRGYPGEAVAATKRHRLLGPGGDDDPFADLPYLDDEEHRP
ncbi:MAG TPA: hypothetical protein VHC67_03405 [Gaiellaceae bacterium]|jgi:hypothetical protein|nr:hypothetical protein [Gaiellaceae bacterium]